MSACIQSSRKKPLDMQCPAQLRTPFATLYLGLRDTDYSFHHKNVLVTCCGRNGLHRKKINLSKSLAGQAVGVKEVEDGIWLVSFMDYDLGYVMSTCGQKICSPSKTPSGRKCYLCIRNDLLPMCPVRTIN